MGYVIASGCCNDASCVEVCPADCIRPHPDDPEFPTAEQLYINADACIGCSACMYACPVAAIHDEFDLPEHLSDFLAINRNYFLEQPLDARFLPAPSKSMTSSLVARVAVIGAGPSGCYAAEQLSANPGIQVTMFDRLPTPFGLVRSGVAPDHPNTKLITDYFQSVLERPNVTCYFNVEVGAGIPLEELRASHHAVIYAGGATGDRKLEIDGESLPGSYSAREFVGWYNGHPDFADMSFDMSGETAVVLGNGNVALDVARVLTRPIDALAATDIADHAIDALRSSNIRDVVIAARRGPAHAACTYPELLELTRMPGVDVHVPSDDLADDERQPLSASRRRKVELFRGLSQADPARSMTTRRITFRFGFEPVRISGQSAVDTLHLQRTGSPEAPLDAIHTGLVLRAVGYQVPRVPGLPYDQSAKTLSNRQGRLVDEGTDRVIAGLFCVGWAKRGPSGVIGTNKICAKETVSALLADLRAGRLPRPTVASDALDAAVHARRPGPVTIAGWGSIDARERQDGRFAAPPKPRRKLVRLEPMLSVAIRRNIAPTRAPVPSPVPSSSSAETGA